MKRSLWICSMLCLCMTPAFAKKTRLYKGEVPDQSGWFIGVGAGAGWSHFDNSVATVPNGSDATPPMNNDTFTINNPSATMIEQFNVGYRWHQEKTFLPYTQVYLQFRNYNAQHMTGVVDQYSLPDFVNYNYRVSYDAALYTLNGKFDLFEVDHRWMPYISVGAGYILTQLYDYVETAIPPVTSRISAGYAGNTFSQFAFTAGLGIDVILTQNTWLTLGYDHVFQGKAISGNGSSTWSGTFLNFGPVKTDTVFVNLSVKVPDGLMG